MSVRFESLWTTVVRGVSPVTTAQATILRAEHILLDFDGPVCAVFGVIADHTVADALRATLASTGQQVTGQLATTTDPFAVLTYAATLPVGTAAEVEAECRRREQEAVSQAPATPHVRELLLWLRDTGRTVTIVSNNATDAVQDYLRNVGLTSLLAGISAREPADMAQLKPKPTLLERAITARGTQPDRCVMVGDSVSDIDAATAIGTPTIAYANKPGKYEKLAARRPAAIVTGMAELLPTENAART